MVKLEDITPGAILKGLAPNAAATVIQVQRVGEDALTVDYKVGQDPALDRMLFRHDEPDLSLVEHGRPWSFDADDLDDKRRGTVGFALTILQRRLASSPEAIYQSLSRRRKRMERRLEEEKIKARGGAVLDSGAGQVPVIDWEDLDDAPDAEVEALEEEIVEASHQTWLGESRTPSPTMRFAALTASSGNAGTRSLRHRFRECYRAGACWVTDDAVRCVHRILPGSGPRDTDVQSA
jgi:hypothetical protein